MTNLVSISFDVGTNDPTAGLGFEFWIDDAKLYDNVIDFEPKNFKFEMFIG